MDGVRAEYRHLLKPDGTPCGGTKTIFAHQVRRGSVRCRVCNPSNARALARDWEQVEHVGRGKATYRHLLRPDGTPCGVMNYKPIRTNRTSPLRCEACSPIGRSRGIEGRWEDDAQAHGWTLVRSLCDKPINEYRHLLKANGEPCGVVVQDTFKRMRKGDVYCPDCQPQQRAGVKGKAKPDATIAKLMDEAHAKGWEYVRRLGTNVEYAHLLRLDGTPCGEVRRVDPSRMRAGEVECFVCRRKTKSFNRPVDPTPTWRAEAEAHGWEFLRRVGNGVEYCHRLRPDGTPCGAHKTTEPGNMRKGTVRCPACFARRSSSTSGTEEEVA